MVRLLTASMIVISLLGAAASPALAETPSDFGETMLQQPDGKLVVAGLSYFDPSWTSSEVTLARYTSDGSLDPTFGGDGRLVLPNPPGITMYVQAIAQQSDAKLILAGQLTHNNSDDAFLVRLLPSGQIDGSYGLDGFVDVGPRTNDGEHSIRVVVDSKDRAVLAYSDTSGTADVILKRFTPSGQPDTTFHAQSIGLNDVHDGPNNGDDGNYESGSIGDLLLQPDGKLVVVGAEQAESNGVGVYGKTLVVRFNSDGSQDCSFAVDGDRGICGDRFYAVNVSDSQHYQIAESVKIDSSNRLVIAGSCTCYANSRFGGYVMRLNADGSLDSSFGSGGTYIPTLTSSQGSMWFPYSVQFGPSGTILVGGACVPNCRPYPLIHTFAAFKLDGNGHPDQSYGGGIAVADFTPGSSEQNTPFDMSVAADGSATLGGWCTECTAQDVPNDTTQINYALSRFTPSGALDHNFGQGGLVVTDFSNAGCAGVANATSAPLAPDLIGPPDATQVRSTSLTFSWGCAGASSYDVYIDGHLRATTQGLSVTIGGLGFGAHTWFVRARNAAGSSDSGQRRFVTFGLRIAALGDSIAAGEGIDYGWKWVENLHRTDGQWEGPANPDPRWESGSDDPLGVCHRSTSAYPPAVARELRADLLWLACTGASTTSGILSNQFHTFDPQGGVSTPAQLGGIAAGDAPPNPRYDAFQPDVVTLTLGADEVDFVGEVTACYQPGETDCSDATTRSRIAAALALQHQNLIAVLSEIRRRGVAAGHVPIVFVTTYYDPFPATYQDCTDTDFRAVHLWRGLLSNVEMANLRRALLKLNANIRDVASQFSNVRVVELERLFSQHTFCSNDPWVYGPSILGHLAEAAKFLIGVSTSPAPFHPTVEGQVAIARAVVERIASSGLPR